MIYIVNVMFMKAICDNFALSFLDIYKLFFALHSYPCLLERTHRHGDDQAGK